MEGSSSNKADDNKLQCSDVSWTDFVGDWVSAQTPSHRLVIQVFYSN